MWLDGQDRTGRTGNNRRVWDFQHAEQSPQAGRERNAKEKLEEGARQAKAAAEALKGQDNAARAQL